MQKYTVNQFFVSNILNWVQEKEIAIPEGFENMEFADYETFLQERRKLMAKKIRKFYENL